MEELKSKDNVKTPRALGCFVFLKNPRPGLNGGDAKYSVMLMFEKSQDLTKVKQAILDAAQVKWGAGAADALKSGKLKSPLRDGDKKFAEGGDETFKNRLFINASSTTRPGIVNTNMEPVDPGEVYSGCFFHAALRFYAYDKNGNKGVGCGLQNLLLVSKGKRIDGRKSADAEFGGFTPDVREGDNEGVQDLF